MARIEGPARRGLCLLAALVLAVTVAAADAPRDLESLMTTLSQVQQVEADYTETIESDLLATAISTRGHLAFAAPDRIVKTGEHGEQVEIDGDLVRVRQDGTEHELSIRDHAPLEHLVVALTATFSGDLARLRRDYTLAFKAQDGGWTLVLTPRERSLLAVFERMEIAGQGADIARIAIAESGGDRRTLRLQVLSRRPPALP
jgi:outer membrane lipoprotein-sorting protein